MNQGTDNVLVGAYVTVIPDEDVEVTGTPKAYQDTATDSGVTMQRWFCPNCGRCVKILDYLAEWALLSFPLLVSLHLIGDKRC